MKALFDDLKQIQQESILITGDLNISRRTESPIRKIGIAKGIIPDIPDLEEFNSINDEIGLVMYDS